MGKSKCSKSNDDHSKSECKRHSHIHYQAQNVLGKWIPLNNQPVFGPDDTYPGAMVPILLTDGCVMVVNDNFPYTGEIWKLTPDINGSYINGTWSQLASLPDGYAPLYFASAVLPDGRVIFMGGEYNGPNYDFAASNLGAIYDPVDDFWTPVNPPPFFNDELFGGGNVISDASCVILEDGTFMLACNYSKQAALLDLKTMTWTETGTLSRDDYNNEAGYTLLPDGKVLTINAYANTNPPDRTGTQIYDPETGNWTYGGSTINELDSFFYVEAGSVNLKSDGTVFAIGANGNTSIYDTCNKTWSVGPKLPSVMSDGPQVTITAPAGIAGPYDCGLGAQPISNSPFSITAPIVPTVPFNADTTVTNNLTGKIALIATDGYHTGSIGKGNRAAAAGAIGCIFYQSLTTDSVNINGSTLVPSTIVDYATGQKFISNLSGLSGTITLGPIEVPLGQADGCGIVLPNNNVLFGVGPSIPLFGKGIHFFEFDGKKLIEQEATPNSPYFPCYQVMMLLLPNGQVLQTDFTADVQIYVPGDNTYDPKWKPVICDVSKKIKAGRTYKIKGVGFNGMTQGSNYGDDYAGATNYPIVRVTNCESGHVFYCRTHDHSFMGVASNKKMHTYFDVPDNIESGKSIIEVIANGIPSKHKHIDVKSDYCSHIEPDICAAPMVLKPNNSDIYNNPKFTRLASLEASELF